MKDVIGSRTSSPKSVISDAASTIKEDVKKTEIPTAGTKKFGTVTILLSSLTCILAVQYVKASYDRKNALKAEEATLEKTEETRVALKALKSETTLADMASKCSQALMDQGFGRASNQLSEASMVSLVKASLFGSRNMNSQSSSENEEAMQAVLLGVLKTEIDQIIGEAYMSEVDKEIIRLNELQSSALNDYKAKNSEDPLVAPMATDDSEAATILKEKIVSL